MNKITRKLFKEAINKRMLKEDDYDDVTNIGDLENNDIEKGKEIKKTPGLFNREFIILTMKNLVDLISNKLTEIKKETVMGEKYIEFKEDEYKDKIKKDCIDNMEFSKVDNSLVFKGLPNLKKSKDGGLEIEDFENEINVLKNTAVDYKTPEELSEYIYGIILAEEIL